MTSQFTNPLPGVPHIESPLFSKLFSEGTHSPEVLRIANELNTRGYAVLDFPDDDLAHRISRIIAALTPELEQEHEGKKRLRPGTRIQDAWKRNADVYALACNTQILELLTTLYGRKAWPFQTLNFPLGSQQHYHTDALHFSSVPERFMCGVWIAFEDIGETQGPLEYYPGSHKWPIYTNEHIGRAVKPREATTQETFHEMWEALVAASGIQCDRFLPRKGQALIWGANLLHGGSAHEDISKTRWSQVTHYYFDDCAYYTPMDSDPFRGIVRFRQPLNLLTNTRSPVVLNGAPIAERFFDGAKSGFDDGPTRETFDAAAYLRANPDVAQAGVDAWEHYSVWGRKEGRSLS